GLTALSNALDTPFADEFVKAVTTIRTITGRVIVTGGGKSGHIGTKIAATFASTGTPAFFVHPSEANHGDLGMIARDDAVLAMSWSGETTELRGVLAYSRRFNIPLIAITSKKDSTLGKEADIVLAIPRKEEACPHNLAPTTSAVMQLALGDALAVALLENRGFTAGDFRTFHPGGQLGASLTHISDIMHSGDQIPLVTTGTLMPNAIDQISEKGFGCVGVTGADGSLIGIITDGDLRRNLGKDLLNETVDSVMTADPKTVQPDSLAISAMEILDSSAITVLMVTKDQIPVGVVHFQDLLRIGVA
ncbi:MAG: KpsF/GutQ family sugar-phosphate isomerase, partial [Rhodobacteraceae bacterium]|nr:KpsF/GutQ family sugar-phosphate isomerase [Paracoccaceae bacterium]